VAQLVIATNKLKRLSAFGSDKAKKTSKSRIRRIFDQADKDGSGALDKHELRSVLRKMFRKSDVSFDSKQLRKYAELQIAEHDSDGSGTIGISLSSHLFPSSLLNCFLLLDFEEFAELYQKIMEDPEIPEDMKKGALASEKEAAGEKEKSSPNLLSVFFDITNLLLPFPHLLSSREIVLQVQVIEFLHKEVVVQVILQEVSDFERFHSSCARGQERFYDRKSVFSSCNNDSVS